MKPFHVVLGVALIAAAALALWGDKTPTSAVVEPVTRPARGGLSRPVSGTAQVRTSGSGSTADLAAPLPLHALISRAELIGGARAGKSDALFASQNWEPPPPPPPPPSRPLPPAPPVAPTLPFMFLGKQLQDGVWQVFLARGDDTFIVHEHSIIDGTYRIDAIVPPQLSLTYLPMKHMQTLFIGGIE